MAKKTVTFTEDTLQNSIKKNKSRPRIREYWKNMDNDINSQSLNGSLYMQDDFVEQLADYVFNNNFKDRNGKIYKKDCISSINDYMMIQMEQSSERYKQNAFEAIFDNFEDINTKISRDEFILYIKTQREDQKTKDKLNKMILYGGGISGVTAYSGLLPIGVAETLVLGCNIF